MDYEGNFFEICCGGPCSVVFSTDSLAVFKAHYALALTQWKIPKDEVAYMACQML
jgi:hypothetical protein